MTTPPATHLVAASEVAGWHSTLVTVCGELTPRAPQSDEDPRYCLECVRAAAQWSAEPLGVCGALTR